MEPLFEALFGRTCSSFDRPAARRRSGRRRHRAPQLWLSEALGERYTDPDEERRDVLSKVRAERELLMKDQKAIQERLGRSWQHL